MKRLYLIGLGLAAMAWATVSATVTYYRDVLPILQNHCQSCHRPGHQAPISFMTYKETRPWAEAIRYLVVSKQMPPWFSEHPYVPASDHRGLKVSEVETIVRWVEQGAEAGNPKDAPPPVYFQESREGRTPRFESPTPIVWRP